MKKQILIRIDIKLLEIIKKIAKEENRSTTNMIETIIKEYIEKSDK